MTMTVGRNESEVCETDEVIPVLGRGSDAACVVVDSPVCSRSAIRQCQGPGLSVSWDLQLP